MVDAARKHRTKRSGGITREVEMIVAITLKMRLGMLCMLGCPAFAARPEVWSQEASELHAASFAELSTSKDQTTGIHRIHRRFDTSSKVPGGDSETTTHRSFGYQRSRNHHNETLQGLEDLPDMVKSLEDAAQVTIEGGKEWSQQVHKTSKGMKALSKLVKRLSRHIKKDTVSEVSAVKEIFDASRATLEVQEVEDEENPAYDVAAPPQKDDQGSTSEGQDDTDTASTTSGAEDDQGSTSEGQDDTDTASTTSGAEDDQGSTSEGQDDTDTATTTAGAEDNQGSTSKARPEPTLPEKVADTKELESDVEEADRLAQQPGAFQAQGGQAVDSKPAKGDSLDKALTDAD